LTLALMPMSSRRNSGANLRQASSPYAGHAVAARATAKEAAYYTKMAQHYSNLAVKAAGQARAYAGNYGAYAGQAMSGSPYSGQVPCTGTENGIAVPGPGQRDNDENLKSLAGCSPQSADDQCQQKYPGKGLSGFYTKDGHLRCRTMDDNALKENAIALETKQQARQATVRQREAYLASQGPPIWMGQELRANARRSVSGSAIGNGQ